MDKRIIELTDKQISYLPIEIQKRIKGRYVLELNGERFYGFMSASDIHRALKPQGIIPYYRDNEYFQQTRQPNTQDHDNDGHQVD